MSRPPNTTYKTTNWRSYNQAPRQRGSLTVWFGPEMQWDAVPSGRRGRQQTYSDAAIRACLTLKVLLGLPNVAATFSWVRLAKRIPVRINIDKVPSGVELAAGMNQSVLSCPALSIRPQLRTSPQSPKKPCTISMR